ncbi:putative mitochondrial protein [Trifolium repens]|nr:putative mitochondrial protein [Trifolium repens]
MPPRVAPVDPTSDPSSPFFVHPSDGPSSVKVSPVLTGANYLSWSRSMRRALGAKLKLEFIDGSLPQPVDPFDPSIRAWNRCNMLVHSWIMNSVSDSIAQSIVFMENALDVWNDLKERFSQGDLLRISELQQEIYSLQQESKTVTEFFSSLKLLWEELEIYLPMPACSCAVRCTCASMRLNDNFSMVKSQILLMDPLPPLNKVFSMVIQHERQGNFPSSDDSKILLNAAKSMANPKAGARVCTYCGKDNHTIDNCFKKHGLPPHLRKSSYAHNASIEGSTSNDVVESGSVTIGSSPITQDQAQQLITLLQNSFPNSTSSFNATNQVGSASFIDHSSLNQGTCHSHFKSCSLGNWIIDSGASHHICNSIQWFRSFNEIHPVTVRLPNGNSVIAKFSGIVTFSKDFSLSNVLCVPNFSANLLSVSALCHQSKFDLLFNASKCVIQDLPNQRMIGLAEAFEGLYYLKLHDKTVNVAAIDCPSTTTIPSQALWHFRLGHLSAARLSLLHSKYPYISVDHKGICDICHLARHRKLPFPLSFNKAAHSYELLHVDIWGPIGTQSIHGYSYFLTIVDDHSRYTWLCLLKNKSETRSKLVGFIKMIETQFNAKIKIIRSDNGVEFLMPEYYSSKGILHQRSCVETPQQNGRVERKHQHLLNVARALLFHSHLPKKFWCYAVIHATYLINRIPTPLLNNKSPFELLFNQDLDLHHLKVFGSLTYSSALTNHRTKLEPRGRKCIFLGYKQGVKGAILYDLHTKEIFISRHVVHHDHILPYQPVTSTTPSWHYHTEFTSPPDLFVPQEIQTHSPNPIALDTAPIINDTIPQNPISISTNSNPNPVITENPTLPANPSPRPVRARQSPSNLKDYVCNHSHDSSIHSSKGILYPISKFHSCHNLSPSHHAYTMSITHHTEPNSYLEACKDEKWIQAMNLELEALTKTGTWKIVDLPPNVNPIGCRWVYRIKFKSDGNVDRYKARLVAKGYNQVEGLDFFDTFSPVAKLTTVRLLLALSSINPWHLHQLDVNNAFLHGELQEDVYMQILDGVFCDKPNQVCKLQKSLYGLKQASRKWNEKLTSLLLREGYEQSTADYSLFTLTKDANFTALLVYVDDIILAGNDLGEISRIKTILDSNFKIKDLGVLKYFLGLEIAHSQLGITISQRKYCLDLLQESGLLWSKPAITPLDPSAKLHQDDSKPYEDVSSYRRLIGKLLYLTNTRPDISFATQQLSQFLQKPTMSHYKAACRVVRYLKMNPGKGLFYPRDSDIQVLGYSDADWAGCVDTRRSTSGYCFFIGNSLVSWKAKKQVTISRSSSEAEYRALSTATCELIWLLFLLRDLKITCSKLPVVYCDSQSALHIASNLVFHERTKHLDIDCHLVWEKLHQGLLKLLPISTADQVADFLTKALPSPKFNQFVSKLGLIDIYQSKT